MVAARIASRHVSDLLLIYRQRRLGPLPLRFIGLARTCVIVQRNHPGDHTDT